jgi:hypothetical protein
MTLWRKYFNNAELPITFYYTDEEDRGSKVKPGSVDRCVIGALGNVRKGEPLCFDADSIGCPGGRKYLGFTDTIMPDFEYFLSCGIPGKMEGERYKKTPEMVKEFMAKHVPSMKAPAKYIVFKRWDMLDVSDTPEVVICFVSPDVLSGLFTLASFDEAEQNTVITPFGSGCSSIVQYPYVESKSDTPRSVIGMFDVSARPSVEGDTLTFSAPMEKFSRMIANMEESFLITRSWATVQKRIP